MKKKSVLLFFQYAFFVFYAGALFAGAGLCRAYGLEKRQRDQQQKLEAGLREALPAFDNQPWEEAFEIEGRKIFPARSERPLKLDDSSQTLAANVLTGFAFLIPVQDGEGRNFALTGLDLDGKIRAVKPVFKRKARVPENQAPFAAAAGEAQRFFKAHRETFFEKAHEAHAAETGAV